MFLVSSNDKWSSNDKRCSNDKRSSNDKRCCFPNFEKNTKKNKIVNFPTKMKRMIPASSGRLSYGALRGAGIVPNMVYFFYALLVFLE